MTAQARDGEGHLGVSVASVKTNLVHFYTERIAAYGPTHEAVDWNSAASQELRFDQVLKVCDSSRAYSVIDYGSGYGALARYLARRGDRFIYQGLDMTPAMVEEARVALADLPDVSFVTDRDDLKPADYAVASGIFNIKLDASHQDWQEYVTETLPELADFATRGFAFNLLTSYSDPPKMRSDLYYADPCFYFDYCKRHFSRNVALLHDYGLYEFTIIVRLDRVAAGAV